MMKIKNVVIVLLFLFIVSIVNADELAEEISIYKGETVVASDFPLKIKYVKEKDSTYILEVEHTKEASCGKNDVILSDKLSSFTCNEEQYVFEFVKLGRNKITFSVKEGELIAEEKVVEEEEEVVEEEKVEEKVEKTLIKEVSICDGCIMGEVCIKEGVQKQESIGGPLYYCGADHKAELVKGIGELCMTDYECEYYYCNNGYCDAKMEGKNTTGILTGVFIGIILILLIVVFLLYKFGIMFKKVSKEEEKMEKEQKKKPLWETSVKGIKRGGPYKYRSEFDVLEKKMKEKFKR